MGDSQKAVTLLSIALCTSSTELLGELESYGCSRLFYNIMSFPLCLECSVVFCIKCSFFIIFVNISCVLQAPYQIVLNCQPVPTTLLCYIMYRKQQKKSKNLPITIYHDVKKSISSTYIMIYYTGKTCNLVIVQC